MTIEERRHPGGWPCGILPSPQRLGVAAWSWDVLRRNRQRSEPSPSGRIRTNLRVQRSTAVSCRGNALRSSLDLKLVRMLPVGGQGEGSNVTFALTVMAVEARTADSQLRSIRPACPTLKKRRAIRIERDIRPVHQRFSAPTPITAEVGATSDPSPCPLPEGEGSLPRLPPLRTPKLPAAGSRRASRLEAGAPSYYTGAPAFTGVRAFRICA